MFKASLTWGTGQLHPHHPKQMLPWKQAVTPQDNSGGACPGSCTKRLLPGTGQNVTQLPPAGLSWPIHKEVPLYLLPHNHLLSSPYWIQRATWLATQEPQSCCRTHHLRPRISPVLISCSPPWKDSGCSHPISFFWDIHHFCRSPSRSRTSGGFLSPHTLDFSSLLQHFVDWGRWNGRQGGPEPLMVSKTEEHHTFTQQHFHTFCFAFCYFTIKYWHLFCLSFHCHFYRTTTKSFSEQSTPGEASIRHEPHCDCPPPPPCMAFVYLQAISSSILSSNHSVQAVLQHISASPSFRYS